MAILQQATDLCKSLAGFIAALILAIGALWRLFRLIKKIRRQRGSKTLQRILGDHSEKEHVAVHSAPKETVQGVILPIVLLIIATIIFCIYFSPPPTCMDMMWQAFKASEYPEAISYADDCIAEFGPTGRKMENDLEAGNTALPPIGSNISADEQKRIFVRGPLNDLGAALDTKGQALQKLGRNTEARKAFEEAAKLQYARTWDPRDHSFWSPADDATERLSEMNK